MLRENPNAVIIESGNVSDAPQKLDLMASVMAQLCYDAVGVGQLDMRVSDEYHKQMAAHGITVVNARPGAPKPSRPYIVKDVAGVRVGVLGFGAPGMGENLNEFAMRRAIYSALKEARERSDILIVIDQLNLIDQAWLERNGRRLGTPDVVIPAPRTPGQNRTASVGGVRFVEIGQQGKFVGVIDAKVVKGGKLELSVKRIDLDEGVPEDQEIVKRIGEFKGVKQVMAAHSPSASKEPMMQMPPTTVHSYFPPAMCAGCHEKQYNDWLGTRHSHAVQTLVDQNRVIPECLKCHSEMYRRVARAMVPANKVAGIECATCHFESLPHGMERAQSQVRFRVNPKMCLDCHNTERSPRYEENSYMARVSHKAHSEVAAGQSMK